MNKIYLDDESEDEKKAGKPDVFAQEFLKTRQILLSGEPLPQHLLYPCYT